MKELLATGSQLQGKASEGGILWRADDAFAQVMGVERGGHVRGLGFGLTLSGTHSRIMEDYMPPSTSIATDLSVKELTTDIAELKEKCSIVDALKAEVML